MDGEWVGIRLSFRTITCLAALRGLPASFLRILVSTIDTSLLSFSFLFFFFGGGTLRGVESLTLTLEITCTLCPNHFKIDDGCDLTVAVHAKGGETLVRTRHASMLLLCVCRYHRS